MISCPFYGDKYAFSLDVYQPVSGVRLVDAILVLLAVALTSNNGKKVIVITSVSTHAHNLLK